MVLPRRPLALWLLACAIASWATSCSTTCLLHVVMPVGVIVFLVQIDTVCLTNQSDAGLKYSPHAGDGRTVAALRAEDRGCLAGSHGLSPLCAREFPGNVQIWRVTRYTEMLQSQTPPRPRSLVEPKRSGRCGEGYPRFGNPLLLRFPADRGSNPRHGQGRT